jgi:hypothetical protein
LAIVFVVTAEALTAGMMAVSIATRTVSTKKGTTCER